MRTLFTVALLLFCFFAFAQKPAIISFSPSSGPVGTSVVITGANFSATAANNVVYFGAVRAAVTTASATSLTVTAPAGATYKPISVLNTATDLTGYSSKPFVAIFSSPFGAGTPADYYKPKVDFATGTNPYSIAVGDIDGDGKADLVVANSGSNTVSVLHNTSPTGTITPSSFAAKVDFAAGLNPVSIAIGDVDSDDIAEVFTANTISNNVSVFQAGTPLITYCPRTLATDLSQVSNWTDNVSGSGGTSPLNFTSPNQIFNVNGNVAKPAV